MESKELVYSVICLVIILTDYRVRAMSNVNTDFDRYLRAINSSTTVPNVEERVIIDSYILAFLNYTYTNSAGEVVRFSQEKARYGEGKILNVEGPLVHVSSSTDVRDDKACRPNILGTQGNPFPERPWIALVRRGECTFEEKVKNVAQKGAIGVIIYNDKPVEHLEKMQIKDKNQGFDVLSLTRRKCLPRCRCPIRICPFGRLRKTFKIPGNITAVMTYQEIGRNMSSIVDQGFEVTASISRGRSGVRPLNTINKTSVLFVSISFIILMIISLVWLIFYYIQRLRYLHSKDQQSRHLCSVTKRAIMKIPTKTGKSNEKDGENDCCAICIEVYKSSDCIRVLPCKHEFHKNCIDPWLIEHRTCPMCKLDVLKYYGYVVGEQQTSASIPSTNERIINANDHIIITPSLNATNNLYGNSSNTSSHSSGSNQINVIVINRAMPSTATNAASTSDTTALNSDSRLNASDSSANSSSCSSTSGLTVITTTASRQVTDV